jgi:exopolysaccharide biosynthesis polyprenyl glycosylphosphotransferase
VREAPLLLARLLHLPIRNNSRSRIKVNSDVCEMAMKAVFPAFDGVSTAEAVQQTGRAAARPDIKRALDIAIAALALIVLSPILALATLAVALDSPGPILFCQRRTGLNGKPFGIYKFRSMTVLEDGTEVIQAVAGDARITRVGRLLRASSIDELPQLFNVLAGDMSLVGPRPHALAHDAYYGARIAGYERRFAVKPGITGWAQVAGARGATPTLNHMQARIDLDIWYADNAGLKLDLLILARTPLEILRHRNAV